MNVARVRFPLAVKVGSVTVKVYRSIDRGKYPKFTVPDYSTGKRRLRQFADFEKAKNEAERLAVLLARGEGVAASSGAVERASHGRALELLGPTGDSLELACARYAAAVEILGGGHLMEAAAQEYARRHPASREHRSVSEVKDELIATREKRGASARYLEDMRHRLGRFGERFGAVPISSISTADVQRWLDDLNLSAQSLVNFRRVLVTLFEHAEARGYIGRAENPALHCETPKVRRSDVQIFSPEELRRLLAAAPTDFQPSLTIGAFAGLRSAELERLTWDAIDLKRGFIKVSAGKAKTGSRRLVPIGETLRLWLEPHSQPTGPVWPGTHDEFYDAQQRTAEATGGPDAPTVEWKANGLRHSFASYRLAQTADAARVAHEMGNSPAVVHAHYAELVTPEEAEAWFGVRPAGMG